MHRRTIALALVTLLPIAAACGSDEDDAEDTSAATPAEAPSKEEFLADANALCAELNSAVEEGQAALGDAPTDEQINTYVVDVIVGEMRTTIAKIRELGFPEGDEETLDGLMDETATILDSIEEDPAAAVAGDDPFAEVNPRLNDYGLTTCGG